MAKNYGKMLKVGDEAVKNATGRTWEQWIRLLDRAGAARLNHRQIVALISERHRLGGWWTQMVTVGYEQARGLRKKHQKPDGFSVSASRTLGVPVSRVFAAFSNAKNRAAWLGAKKVVVRRATRNKSMRITWLADDTRVDVNFHARGPAGSMVAVQHSRLSGADAAAKMKAHWGKALDALRDKLA